MNRWLSILLAGGLLLVSPTPALAAPADVRVRVEGKDATLVERTAVRTTTTPVNKDGVAGHDCTGTSAAGALETAVAGDWSGSFFNGLGYTVERIRTREPHRSPSPTSSSCGSTTARWPWASAAIELQDGDDVLLFVARCEFDPVTFAVHERRRCCRSASASPARSRPGAPFSVTVVEYATDGTPTPVAGATVAGGDAPATTNAAGSATVTVAAGGPRTLEATKAGRARSASEPVCATSGSDGLCGSAARSTTRAAAPTATTGAAARSTARAPAANIRGIAEGRRFGRGFGPRVLRARRRRRPVRACASSSCA